MKSNEQWQLFSSGPLLFILPDYLSYLIYLSLEGLVCFVCLLGDGTRRWRRGPSSYLLFLSLSLSLSLSHSLTLSVG